MEDLLASYLPVVIFIGVAAALGLGLLVAPFIIAYKNPDPESSRPMSAASMRSTTRA